MTKNRTYPDAARFRLNELQNHVIDEFRAGTINRRGLLRHGSAYGISTAFLGGLAGLPLTAHAAVKPNVVIRIAITAPTGAINPLTVDDVGGLVLLQQTGEFLLFDNPDLHLKPALATTWASNHDGSVWTFKLRKGVKFHNGKIMTADDVVFTFARLADPKVGSNALSTFKGVLSPKGIVKVDDHTVAFHLDAPNGNFPYLVSSDNYNAIVLPAGSDASSFQKHFEGTGPFRFESYMPGRGASFVRNPDYWGGKVLPARTVFNFYNNQQSQILALQSGQVDVIQQIAVQGAQGLLHNPAVKIINIRSSTHREVHMRNDVAPFKDKRVRQAVALTLNRPAIIKGLFRGLSDLGNDSPFAPIFPSTDTNVPQRHKGIEKARHLMKEAGLEHGASVTLTTLKLQEIPDYAVLIQNAAAEIGLKIKLKIETGSAYFGKATYGNSDWLDSHMGITDYGHRGVPNVFLSAPLLSNGTWNAAHFRNRTYDGLVKDYVAAVDLKSQRQVAGKIEELLLDETPIIYAYFYNYLAATAPRVSGVVVTGMSQVFLQHTTIA